MDIWRFGDLPIGAIGGSSARAWLAYALPRSGRAIPHSDHQITRSRIRQAESGFTLIELLVVASILVVLAGMGLVQYRNGKTRASEAVLKTDLFNMRDAIDQYYADKGMYPATIDELVSSGYLRKVPDDPFTTSASTWQTVASEPDPNNPNAPPGVYDVKSGSDATALDGTKYADW